MHRNNFYFLFVGLLIALGVEPFLANTPSSGPLIQLAFTSILVIGAFSLSANRWVFHLGLVFAAVALLSSLGFLLTGSIAVRLIDLAAIICFMALAIGVTVERVVLTPGAITLNRVVGALCLYLLLGTLWMLLYGLVELISPGAFRYTGGDAPGDPLDQFMYYSFVTLTTLGYGDITPVHPVARTLAYLEALLGQLYIAVLVASLVGQHAADQSSRTDS